MANTLSCLICSSEVVGDDDEENSGKKSQFGFGLQLFCKLLKISGHHVDKLLLVGGMGHEGNAVGMGPPCCKECWLAFEQILRLHQAIKLMQANLMEQFGKLKAALQTSVPSDHEEDPLKIPPDDIFGKIRDQLVSCVRKPCTPIHQPSKRKRSHPSKSSKQQDLVFLKRAKEYQPCSVLLERLPLIQLSTLQAGITFKQEIISSNNHPGDNGNRKSKQKAFEDNSNDLNDEEYVPYLDALLPSPSNFGDDPPDDEDDYPWESEAKPIPEPLPNKIISCFGTGTLTKFSLISPDTLLYQYPLIKVSQGYTHFTCQEPECPSPHFSDPSLNWTNLFYQIAHHIKSIHSTPAKEFECPLCPATFSSGPQFRYHLIGVSRKHSKQEGHSIETVICEICLKPIRNLADAFRCHMWYHKNDQEKEDSPDGLPPTLRSKANRMAKRKQTRKSRKILLRKFKPRDDGGRGTRKCKQKALEFIRNMSNAEIPLVISAPVKEDNCSDFNGDEYVPLPEAPSPVQSNHNDVDEHVCPWDSEAKPILEQFPNHLFPNCGASRHSKFSLISPDTLLFHYTLITVTQGFTQFTCQEPGCPSSHFSDSLLNWNSVFSQIAHHIESMHGTPSPEDQLVRKCPLCPDIFPAGSKFRAHLVGVSRIHGKQMGHGIETVVCEICWKPIRNKADNYKSHKWSHNNSQEKEHAGPPSSILSKTNQRLRKMGLKIKKKNIKPDPEIAVKLATGRGPKRGDNGSIKIDDHFSQILEDSGKGYLLLHKYTLLKASYGVSLTCQDSNCDHIINGTDFTAFETFKTHVTTCHADDTTNKPDTIWKCPLCSEKLKTCNGFRRHLLYNCSAATSSDNYRLKCRHCKRGFESVSNLRAHEATHVPKEQRKKYMCHQCPRLFLSPVAVQGHVEREHERGLMRMRTCPICTKQYNWRDGYSYRSHLRSHRNERPFVCEICGKAFVNTVGLKSHTETVHENKGERPWQCEFCEMNYKESKHLTRHRRNAHKDKVGEEMGMKGEEKEVVFGPKIAFPCPVCERAFPLRSRMKKHWEKSCKN